MKIIISPAKTMREESDIDIGTHLPVLLEQTKVLLAYLQKQDRNTLKDILACNEKLVELNFDRFMHMQLEQALTPAIFSYDGIQYQYMAPRVMEAHALDYIKEHLCILSGFYGVVRPYDRVVPYRLEMQARFSKGTYPNLYAFWSDRIYKEVTKDDHIIFNLASKEYAKALQPFLKEKDRWVDVIFAQEDGGKLVQRATLAKMARGEMVRFLSNINAKKPEEACAFDRLGFTYSQEHSKKDKLVFVKIKKVG